MSYYGRSNRVAKQVAKASGYSTPLQGKGGLYDGNSTLSGEKGNGIYDTDKSTEEVKAIKAEIAARIQRRNRNNRIALIVFGAAVMTAVMIFLYYQ